MDTLAEILSLVASIGLTIIALIFELDIISPEAKDAADIVTAVSTTPVSTIAPV